MSRIVTASDIARLTPAEVGAGLELVEGDRISPQAIDLARERHVAIRWRTAGTTGPPGPLASAAAARGSLPDAVEGTLVARIRDAVQTVLASSDGNNDNDIVDRVLQLLSTSSGGDASLTVTQRLARFVVETARRGVPPHVLHEAQRLILNDCKASVRAIDHAFVKQMLAHAELRAPARGPRATVLWHGVQVDPDDAAAINAVLFEILDFNETYVPTYVHVAPAVLAAALAVAQVQRSSGRKLLEALVIGVEVELAVSIMVMPGAYERGFLPGVLSGRVGAAAASAVLFELDEAQTVAALAYAMLSGGGLFEGVGSTIVAWVKAEAARAGLAGARLAAGGADGPASAFEGDKGMLGAFGQLGDERCGPILDSLGTTWRTMEASYKRFQAETIDQAPLQALFDVRSRGRRVEDVKRIVFSVDPLVASIAAERYRRFGAPSSDLQATFDLRYVMAAAWILGRTGGDVYSERFFRDPTILALRDRIEVLGDPGRPLDSARVDVTFADGTEEFADVAVFKGSPEAPLSDDELSTVLDEVIGDRLSSARVAAIERAIDRLASAPNIEEVMSSIIAR